jgi:hypothetical protein
MRRFKLTILFALATLLLTATASAQSTASVSVPNLIRYSGTLKNAEGAAVSSSTPVGVIFSIYKQQDGGAAVWQETQNVTPDANGQYNVLLGSTTAAGLPDDLFSTQDERWLGVQVQGQEEQARVLLVSVPYAFKAHEADTLGGLPASAFVQAAPSGASGSGSSAPGTAVNALGNVANQGVVSTGQGPSKKHLPPGPCTPQSGFLTYWDSTGALCASSILQIANGNVGIGVTNPSEPLDVQGAISSYTAYDLFEQPILYVGNPGSGTSTNLMVGFSAGASNTGNYNAFVGTEAGVNHTVGDANVYVGYRAGDHNSGTSNVSVGYQAGFNNGHGNNDVYIGRSAGFNSTGGSSNTCVGYAACYYTTASNNTAYGSQSGQANTTGAQNTFIGNDAGNTNTIGSGNTFVGNSAGQNSYDSGGGNCCNTIVGDAAGQGGTGNAAAGNSYFGYEAGLVTTTGGKNVFSGYKSGVANTTGSFNSFYGDQSGQNSSTGSYNTFLGISTAGSLTSGSYNTFVGQFAGNNATGGNSDVYLANPGVNSENNTLRLGDNGTGMGQQNLIFVTPILGNPTTLTSPYVVTINNTSGQLGYQTISAAGGVTGNCTPPSGGNYITQWLTMTSVGCSGIFQQNTTNFIGIGTTTPSVALDVNGPINTAQNYQIVETPVLTIGNNEDPFDGDVFVGPYAGFSNVGGGHQGNTALGEYAGYYCCGIGYNSNTFVGFQAGYCINAGQNNIDLGAGTGPGCSSGGTPESETIRIGTPSSGGQTTTFVAGIWNSTATPIAGDQVVCVQQNTGELYGAAFGTDCTTSSRRFKDHIADMGDNSSKLFQLRPVTFFYKSQYENGSHALQYGLIAEEVAKVYPEMAAYDKDGQPYAVRYQLLTPMLLNELQKEHAVVMSQQDQLTTQLQQIKAQRQEIDGLKRDLLLQNASLQERLQKLESYVATQMKTASEVQTAATTASTGGLR